MRYVRGHGEAPSWRHVYLLLRTGRLDECHQYLLERFAKENYGWVYIITGIYA